ncbi:MAG: esterase, partial [Bacteroides sp.]|nr:esterase [Bacteroides sp.]
WIGIGKEDFLYEKNKTLRNLLDEHGYPYTYYESEGGHIWKNWRSYLSRFLLELFK